MKIRLYELGTYHRPDGHRHVWYLCAGSKGYQSRADDTPASVTWLPLVGQWASVLVQAAGAAGGTAPQRDDLTLINVRAADTLPRWANVFDATAGVWLRVPLGLRPLNPLVTDYVIQTITEKEVDDDDAYSTAVIVWTARAGLPVPERTSIKLPLYDRQTDFDEPVQTDRYAGTGGYEGPAEMKDVLKEVPLGHVPMASPTYLGIIGDLHRWSVGGGKPVFDVPRGWSLGVPVTKTAGTPSSSQFAVDLATGFLTTAVKFEDFRVEVKGRLFGGVWKRYIGELSAALALEAGIVTSADVSEMDATPRTVGLYLPSGDGRSHKDVLDKLVGSVARGRWYVALSDGLVITRLPRADAATPERAYSTVSGSTPGLKPLTRTNTPPAKQTILRYAENPNPVTQTAPDATDPADVALWTQAWREVAGETDDAIVAAYGAGAKVATIETALTLPADAAAELPHWEVETKSPPQPYELKVRDGAPGLWIGDAVMVVDDVAGFESGGPLVLYGRTNRDRGGGATLYGER
ncbi:hypothetical protein ABMY26_36580 (plasmid) [Azospirillum sp. HJ39]|uniref:hypothetical protein n=1 Tax=Azospirillum sp. HJ39 TaxID=3159496 RepID=UPI0035574C5E